MTDSKAPQNTESEPSSGEPGDQGPLQLPDEGSVIDAQSVEGLFLRALQKDSVEERSRFLEDSCGDDVERQRRVQALLVAYDDAGSFLESPAAGPRSLADVSLDFLQPSNVPGCLGTLGQYQIQEVIGRGGMGVVLRAIDPTLNRIVAVKVLLPELAANPNARRRFLREAQAAAAISHPHVVTIHAVDGTGDGTGTMPPYLVMECVVGQSLQGKLSQVGPLPLAEILRISRQVAEGLAAAHRQGLIHRDIKPANILLENGVERVKITDFGLARAVDDITVTRTGEVTGTPQYMSPEQASGERVDQRSDLFSLGSVMYAMCTGHSPFRGDSMAHVIRRVTQESPHAIADRNPDIPGWLAQIIDCLLQKDPNQRIQTAEGLVAVLDQHLARIQQAMDSGSHSVINQQFVRDEVSAAASGPTGQRVESSEPDSSANGAVRLLPARWLWTEIPVPAIVSVATMVIAGAALSLYAFGDGMIHTGYRSIDVLRGPGEVVGLILVSALLVAALCRVILGNGHILTSVILNKIALLLAFVMALVWFTIVRDLNTRDWEHGVALLVSLPLIVWCAWKVKSHIERCNVELQSVTGEIESNRARIGRYMILAGLLLQLTAFALPGNAFMGKAVLAGVAVILVGIKLRLVASKNHEVRRPIVFSLPLSLLVMGTCIMFVSILTVRGVNSAQSPSAPALRTAGQRSGSQPGVRQPGITFSASLPQVVPGSGGIIVEVADEGLEVYLASGPGGLPAMLGPLDSGEHEVPTGTFRVVVRDSLAGWLSENPQTFDFEPFSRVPVGFGTDVGRFNLGSSNEEAYPQYEVTGVEVKPGEFAHVVVRRDLAVLRDHHEEVVDGHFYRLLWNGRVYTLSSDQTRIVKLLVAGMANGDSSLREPNIPVLLPTLGDAWTDGGVKAIFNDGKHPAWDSVVSWAEQDGKRTVVMVPLKGAASDQPKADAVNFTETPHGDRTSSLMFGESGDYRVSVGDLLRIHIPHVTPGETEHIDSFSEPPNDGVPVLVTEDGVIDLPYGCSIDTSGKTVSEIAEQVRVFYVEERDILKSDAIGVVVRVQRRAKPESATWLRAYRIRSGDVLGVWNSSIVATDPLARSEAPPVVFSEGSLLPPAFGDSVTVDEDGAVELPMVGRITLAGLSLAEARGRIIKAYTQDQDIFRPEAIGVVQVTVRQSSEVVELSAGTDDAEADAP